MNMKHVVIAFQLFFLCTASTFSQYSAQKEGRFSVAGLDDDREVEQFFISFKEALGQNDKKRIASLVSYPIKVNLASGQSKRIRNAADFVRAYDRIFDAKFKLVIMGTDVRGLWARWSGVAMPRGEIWFNGIVKDAKRRNKYTIKITAINGPIRS